MPQTVLVETLNLLSDNLNRASASSPVGNSNHPYYSTDQFKDYTYPNIRVKSHDIGLVEGDFTHILFTPADAHERCKAASKMYEGGHIQAEIDFFHPKDHVPFQVGQVGVTDCNHKYWPLMYIVSPSENKDACKKLLLESIEMLEENNCKVSVLLSDGGEAILRAINDINESRQICGLNGVKKRRCFAHVVRLPGMRGGGKRGSLGSLARYLVTKFTSSETASVNKNDGGTTTSTKPEKTQTCPQKLMPEIMSKVILFNYLPGAETFEHAMRLLINEYKAYLNEHVLQNYLDPHDPCKLGGRAANEFQGQNGSTQGMERRGGHVKDKLKDLSKGLKPTARANPLLVLEAVADDMKFKFTKGVAEFQTEPPRHKDDASIVNALSAYTRGGMSSDITNMLFMSEEGRFVDSSE